MTAPFAPPPPRVAGVMLIGVPVILVATPFRRRDDWIGWLAYSAVMCWAYILLGMLIYGMAIRGLDWWRGTPGE